MTIDQNITTRDFFAGLALAGEFACQDEGSFWTSDIFNKLAERCYQVADAMLEERKERHEAAEELASFLSQIRTYAGAHGRTDWIESLDKITRGESGTP